MDMRTHGNSISLAQPMVPSFTKVIFEHEKRMLTLLHAWARLRKYWKTRKFRGEVDFHLLQSFLGQGQRQKRQQKEDYTAPKFYFENKHVKEESHDMTGVAFQTSIVFSFLRSLDPYWVSQLMMEYSKDLFTC